MKQYKFLDNSTIEVDDNACRGCYLENTDDLPEELEPVWANDFFSIKQDAECPVPGFYIVSTRQHIHTVGDLSVEQASQLGIIVNRMRNIMREHLGIMRVHIIVEERIIEPHLHIWLLPLWQEIMNKYNIDPKVWNSNILEYIQLFTYEDNKETIRAFNMQMRNELANDKILSNL